MTKVGFVADHCESATNAPSEDDADLVARQLNKLIEKVTTEGVGPLTGAITWADDRRERARRKQGAGVGDPADASGGNAAVDQAVRRLIRESVQAAAS